MALRCKYGFVDKFSHTIDRDCKLDYQPNGATVTDLHVFDTYQFSGRTGYIVEGIANKVGIRGRVVNFDGVPMKVTGFMSCLIPGHDEGHCTHQYSELTAKAI